MQQKEICIKKIHTIKTHQEYPTYYSMFSAQNITQLFLKETMSFKTYPTIE